jgi:hypothetical protein
MHNSSIVTNNVDLSSLWINLLVLGFGNDTKSHSDVAAVLCEQLCIQNYVRGGFCGYTRSRI